MFGEADTPAFRGIEKDRRFPWERRFFFADFATGPDRRFVNPFLTLPVQAAGSRLLARLRGGLGVNCVSWG